jgi:hypothetical protein
MKQEINEKVEEFIYRLCKCKREWSSTDHTRFDRDLPHIFKNGLKPDIAAHLSSYIFKDIDDLIKKAKEVERILLKKEETKTIENAEISVESVISNKLREIKCFKCSKTGHIAKDCLDKAEKPKKYCMFCGKNNHLAIDCIVMKKQIEGFKRKTHENTTEPRFSRKYCSICKMNNHNTQDCRKNKTAATRNKDQCFENTCEKPNNLNV